jgi:hypothetical protein
MAATKKLTANFFQEDLVGRRSILVSCIMFFTGVFKRAERQPTVLKCFYEKKVCLSRNVVVVVSRMHDHASLQQRRPLFLFTGLLTQFHY